MQKFKEIAEPHKYLLTLTVNSPRVHVTLRGPDPFIAQ